MANFSAHRTNEHAVLVQLVNNVARHTEAGNKYSRATFDDQINVTFKRVGKGGQQVHAKSFVGQLLHTVNFGF